MRQEGTAPMANSSKTKRKNLPQTVLKLPDLEQSKSAVLNSLAFANSQRSYAHAIRELIEWYCSERGLSDYESCGRATSVCGCWKRVPIETGSAKTAMKDGSWACAARQRKTQVPRLASL